MQHCRRVMTKLQCSVFNSRNISTNDYAHRIVSKIGRRGQVTMTTELECIGAYQMACLGGGLHSPSCICIVNI